MFPRAESCGGKEGVGEGAHEKGKNPARLERDERSRAHNIDRHSHHRSKSFREETVHYHYPDDDDSDDDLEPLTRHITEGKKKFKTLPGWNHMIERGPHGSSLGL